MSRSRFRLASLVPMLVAGTALLAPLPAQVPAGSAVVGTFYGANPGGTPGLFIVDLHTGTVTPITGLPSPLTAQITDQGVWSVALRSSDGAVIVGSVGAGAVHAYVLHLSCSAVATNRDHLSRRHPVDDRRWRARYRAAG